MPDTYFTRYLPLLIQLCLAGGLGCVMVLLSWFIGQHKYNKAKMSPYECGMTPIGDARQRFSVKFYLVAMLFILFDVEAVFTSIPGQSSSKTSRCSAFGRCWCISASYWLVIGTS